MSPKLLTRSLLHSLGVVVYVLAVAAVMQQAERLFGPVNSILAATGFLLLFSVSAAVVGSLIFGYPAILFLNGQKREAVMTVGATIGWMMVETIAVLAILLVIK